MDANLRSTINMLSVIVYVVTVVAFYDYPIFRLAGVIVVAAIQIAISVTVIILSKNNPRAKRMEISMICVCVSVACYVVYIMVASN